MSSEVVLRIKYIKNNNRSAAVLVGDYFLSISKVPHHSRHVLVSRTCQGYPLQLPL